jgi:hypothetical protein
VKTNIVMKHNSCPACQRRPRTLGHLAEEYCAVIPLAEAYALVARLVRAELWRAIAHDRQAGGFAALPERWQAAWLDYERRVSPPEAAEALATLARARLGLPEFFASLPPGPPEFHDLERALARLRRESASSEAPVNAP